MNKFFKISLKILAGLFIAIVIVGTVGWFYLYRSLLNIDGVDPLEEVLTQELTVDDFTFIDRNKNGKLDVYEDSRKDIKDRVEDLLSQMTLEEKLLILKGSGARLEAGVIFNTEKGVSGAAGNTVPIHRLGLPTLYLADGPAGLRISPTRDNDPNTYYCTAFPIGTVLASTWNTDLVREVGKAMGQEAKEYGVDVVLGPGVNIHRNPLNGRNFEYYSEDPLLTGKIGAAMVNGIEMNGVGATPKHFAVNTQETKRSYNDARVSERALREIYLKGFEIIVKDAQPWTIMSSYNLVNGVYTSESKELLTDIMREEWGFEGLVMTDWFAGDDAAAQIKAGNDLLEPGTRNQFNALKDAAESGRLTEQEINIAAGRVLKMILQSHKMKDYSFSNKPDLNAHAEITRQSAAEGMTLLKNNQVLPLKEDSEIALFGVTSYNFIAGGTGSGDVNEAYTVSLEEGLKNAGFKVNEEARQEFENFKSRNIEAFEKKEGLSAMLDSSTPPEMSVSDSSARIAAEKSDLAIITIGRNSGEGKDRIKQDDFNLSETELELIQTVSKEFHEAGKKVVVVMNIGGVIETASWKDQPDAILLAWQGGQEGGNSVADILKGAVNPSGKLPMTFPLRLEDHASTSNFPQEGEPLTFSSFFFDELVEEESERIKNYDYTDHAEGIYVGYRHFDKNEIEVSFPFGFGLSYTEFMIDSLGVEASDEMINVAVRVTNTGKFAGKEVLQLYAGKSDTKIDRPVQELKAFAKTKLLQPGESTVLELSFQVSELSYWDENEDKWVLEPGEYELRIGKNSREIAGKVVLGL